MFRLTTIFFFILFSYGLYAQEQVVNDTIWNQTDNTGLKQAYWKKQYPDATLMYKGFFKDGKPLGEFRRYYENGKLMALMNHHPDGIRSSAILYYQNGNLAAEGNYTGQLKDSIWNYYSYYSQALMYAENYINGIKEGESKIFYTSGKVAELQYWKDNLKQGRWFQYYEDSSILKESDYRNDTLTGNYTIYDTDGRKVIEGKYIDGKRDGPWSFYNQDGELEYQLKYKNGLNLNEEEYMDRALQYMKEIEEKTGTIPEPDIDNFMQRR